MTTNKQLRELAEKAESALEAYWRAMLAALEKLISAHHEAHRKQGGSND